MRRSLAELAPSLEPPREFRIFPFGVIETSWGSYLFTPEDGQALMERWRRWGNQIPIDYDHQMLDGPPPSPAAGWADLELRQDGLWAVNVTWTPRAVEFLRNREYRYISPAFHTDVRKDGEHVVELVNLALTNLPATHKLEPLVARAVPWSGGRVVEGAWDADAAVARVRRWASSDGSGDKDTIDWDRYARAFAWYDAEDRENFGAYKLPHHDVRDGELVVHKGGVQAAAAALQGARGGVDIPERDLEAVRRHIARHYHQWDEKAPWEREDSMDELRREIHKLTGAASDSEALGILTAWRQASEELEKARQRLAELEAELRSREVEEVISAAKREGKLAPAMEEWARELGKRDLEMLRAYVRSAPSLIQTTAREPVPEVTVEQFRRMSYIQRAELYRQHPELYRKLRDAEEVS